MKLKHSRFHSSSIILRIQPMNTIILYNHTMKRSKYHFTPFDTGYHYKCQIRTKIEYYYTIWVRDAQYSIIWFDRFQNYLHNLTGEITIRSTATLPLMQHCKLVDVSMTNLPMNSIHNLEPVHYLTCKTGCLFVEMSSFPPYSKGKMTDPTQ